MGGPSHVHTKLRPQDGMSVLSGHPPKTMTSSVPTAPPGWTYERKYRQKYTPNYYERQVLVSLLQKAVRRNELRLALFAAKELYLCDEGYPPPTPIRSNLVNRLLVIVSEDIGIADPTLCLRVRDALLPENERAPTMDDIGRVVAALCAAPKCREADEIIHCAMYPGDYDPGTPQTARRTFRLEKKDPRMLRYLMNRFQYHLNRDECAQCAHWAQQVLDLKAPCHPRRTSKNGRSRKGIYAVWQALFRKSGRVYRDLDLMRDRVSFQILSTLKKLFGRRQNGRTERLPLVHAIMFACAGPLLDRAPVTPLPPLGPVAAGLVAAHAKVPVPDWAYDKHTRKGLALGRGTAHFYDVGAVLANQWRPSPFAAAARAADLARETRPRERKRRAPVVPDAGRPKKRRKKVQRKTRPVGSRGVLVPFKPHEPMKVVAFNGFRDIQRLIGGPFAIASPTAAPPMLAKDGLVALVVEDAMYRDINTCGPNSRLADYGWMGMRGDAIVAKSARGSGNFTWLSDALCEKVMTYDIDAEV